MLYTNKIIAINTNDNISERSILFTLATLIASESHLNKNLPIIGLRVLVNIKWIQDPTLFLIMVGLDRLPKPIKKSSGWYQY